MSRQDYIQATNKAGFEKALKEGKISEEQIGFIEEEDLIWAKGNYYGAVPDNEDLTKDKDGKLQFSDRSYNPANFSGKGYKILRRNIVQERNVLTQEMMAEPNTIYEIRYDFDLSGETINVPEGCVLKFEGGSLKNGTLNGNETNICSDLYHILKELDIKGTWILKELYPEWFGALGDEVNDDTVAIQRSIDSASICKSTVLFTKNYFVPKGSINLKSNISIISNNNSKIITDCKEEYYKYIVGNYQLDTKLENILIKGIYFDQKDIITKSYDTGEIRLRPIFIVNSSNIIIEDCNFSLKGANAIFIGGDNRDITITNNKIFNGDKNDINVDQSAIYVEAVNVDISNNLCADYTNKTNSLRGGIEVHGSNFIVSNNIIENVDSAFNITPFRGKKDTEKQNIVSNNSATNVKYFISLWNQGSEDITLGNLFIDSNIAKCARPLWNVTSSTLKSVIRNITLTNNVFTYIDSYINVTNSEEFRNTYALLFWCYNKIENIIIKNNIFNDYPTGIVYIDGSSAKADVVIEYNRFNNLMSIPINNILEFTKKNWVSIIYNNNKSRIIFNNNYISVNEGVDFFFTFGAGVINEFNNNVNNTNNIIGIQEFLSNTKEHKILVPNIDRHGYKNDIIKFNNQLLSEIVENGTIDSNKVTGSLCKLNNHVFINNSKGLYLKDIISFSTNSYSCKKALIVAIINNKYFIESKDESFNVDNINDGYEEVLSECSFVFPKTNHIKTCNIITNKSDIDGDVTNGSVFFDTDKNVLTLYNNTWIDSQGNPADALKKGTTSQRPTGVQPGFHYFDTDLGHDMVWDGQEWYDPTNKDEFSDLYKIMYNQHASVSVSSNVPGNIIEKGVPKAVTLSWNYIFNGASTTPDTLQLKSGQDVLVGDKGTKTYTDNIQDTKTYQVVSIMKGVTKTAGITINAYYPIYYGGSSKTTLTSDDVLAFTKHGAIKSNPSGSYNFQVDAGEYAWICVPAGMVINKVTSNGFGVPIEPLATVAVTGKGNYNCYRSSETFTSGMFSCVVG